MASSANSNNKSGGKARIDVSSTGPALTQNPFAKLAVAAAPSVSADPPPAPTTAPQPAAKKTTRGRLLLRRETKHRGGKTVVIVSGFATLRPRDAKTLDEVEKHLKQRLGCGGSIDLEKQEVLIQGDRPDEIAALLKALGFDVGGVIAKPGR